ncbi:hypothetical protein [Nostoc sp.]
MGASRTPTEKQASKSVILFERNYHSAKAIAIPCCKSGVSVALFANCCNC